LQYGLQAEVLRQGDDRFKETSHPLLGIHEFTGLVNKAGEQLIHPGSGKDRPVTSSGGMDWLAHCAASRVEVPAGPSCQLDAVRNRLPLPGRSD
jgi:hypothetical protein